MDDCIVASHATAIVEVESGVLGVVGTWQDTKKVGELLCSEEGGVRIVGKLSGGTECQFDSNEASCHNRKEKHHKLLLFK